MKVASTIIVGRDDLVRPYADMPIDDINISMLTMSKQYNGLDVESIDIIIFTEGDEKLSTKILKNKYGGRGQVIPNINLIKDGVRNQTLEQCLMATRRDSTPKDDGTPYWEGYRRGYIDASDKATDRVARCDERHPQNLINAAIAYFKSPKSGA